jgi:mRNA degradation ribonuclease J1/J2
MQAESALAELMVRKVTFSEIKSTVKTAVSKYIYRKTQRSPMIIPVIMNAE